MTQAAWERAMGMAGYIGSPAASEDRRLGIKIGGQCRWLVTPRPLIGTITAIDIDSDGDPWFHLTFDGDHKDVRVERSEIAPLRKDHRFAAWEDGRGATEPDANARLIAAAPDLLEAVKDARAMLAMVEVIDGEDGDPWSKALARMDAAIAKATDAVREAQMDGAA
jgi:hypothetical protein